MLIFKIYYDKLSSLKKNWKYWDHRSYPLSDRVTVIIKSQTAVYLQFYLHLMREYSKINALRVYINVYADPSLAWYMRN